MVDACHRTGIPTTIVVGGRARNWDPRDRRGLRVIYDQVACWARRAMIHRINEIYSDPAKAKPCIVIVSGTGFYDTMTNDDDDYHLHPGEGKADLHRFADWLC